MQIRRLIPFIVLGVLFVAAAIGTATLISAIATASVDDWTLVFLQLKSTWHVVAISLACGVAVTLIALLHQFERTLISPRLGGALLMLRMGLVLVVFLSLLEPVWTWTIDEQQSGRVVVALDVSESMETHDAHARLLEKLQWAQSLGMFDRGQSKEQADRWIDDLKQDKEPEWVSPSEEPDEQARNVKSKLRREDVENTLLTVTDYSRMELAARALVSEQDSLFPRLAESVETEMTIFAENHAVMDEEGIKHLLDGNNVTIRRDSSSLIESMKSALESDSNVPLVGLIVISDGIDTSETQRRELVQRMSGLSVPVHTVMVGSEIRPRDLAVTHIDAPESIFEDDTPVVTAAIQSFGFENEEVQVFVDWLDNPQHDPLQQSIVANGTTSELSFNLDGLEVGRHHFRLRTAIRDDELRDDNNSREFAIQVVDDRANVLLIDNEGRWEFRYLAAALERDKRVALESVLFEQPYLGVLNKPFFLKKLTALAEDEPEATRYSKFDCVVIGDVSPAHVPIAEWKVLERYVRDEGGTLVLTAGKNDFPMNYRGTLIDGLMPVEDLREIHLRGGDQILPPDQRGFHLSITPDGQRMAMFQLGADWADSARIWDRLPGHTWGITGRVKGGASVFAAALDRGERPSLEMERERGVIAQHFVGSGQVLWIGIDSTWRWRFRVGDQYHHRFWGQLIRWAVSFKSSSGNDAVRLSLTPAMIQEGESTLLRTRWDEKFSRDHPQLKAFAVVENMNTNFRQRTELKKNPSLPFTDEVEIKGLDPGEYRVTIDIPDVPWEGEIPEERLIVRENVSRELFDVTADRALLQEISDSSGGKFVLLHEIGKLPQLFKRQDKTVSRTEEIPLWSHWSTLAIFCAIAMAEWVTRKLNGLP